ncbi:MAG: hypothetical protein ABIO94_04295, partial [Opitutaceae bacterium]
LDRGGLRVGASLGGLRETFTKNSQVRYFVGLEFGESARQIRNRVVKPLFLIVRVTPDNTALHDVLEQLVTSFLVRRIDCYVATWPKLWFCHFLWVVRLTDAPGT